MEVRLKEWLWPVLALALAILIAYLLISMAADAEQGPPPLTIPETPSKYDTHLIELDRTALERAYSAQLQLLFATWLRDDIGTTHRVRNGLRIARRAYIYAAGELEKREETVKKGIKQ